MLTDWCKIIAIDVSTQKAEYSKKANFNQKKIERHSVYKSEPKYQPNYKNDLQDTALQ
jgi:hypothetical protein